ncbi:polyketide synthase PksN [Pantoea alhagi]|uniref:beta-ketoacyl synthase N-terminal-like domain-containing protein n=1 Tax=Mixta sp. BE291 TaxID=3158787 RepID=UPI0028676B46|nr:polyketide synthase PksN [Pantoea alhagi]
MKKLLTDIVWLELKSMGMFQRAQQPVEQMIAEAGIIPLYQRWVKEWLRLFQLEGYINLKQAQVNLLNPPTILPQEIEHRWAHEKRRWERNRCLKAQITVLSSVINVLPDILTGRVLATEILFPDSSLALVEEIYKTSPVANYFNQTLTDSVMEYISWRISNEPNPQIRIIEIGAGTGATSALLFNKLANYGAAIKEYCYTDISNAFLNHAEKSYAMQNPWLTTRILNIEKNIESQGFTPGEFDIVIAANVLHATKNMRHTMRNVKALLKQNGLIFLNEFCLNNLFSHMTFGMLEGWWYYDDEYLRIPGSPGLNEANWKYVLEAEGFRSVSFMVDKAQSFEQQIIIAESDGLIRQAAPVISEPSAARATGTIAQDKSPRSDAIYTVVTDELSRSLRIDKNKIMIDEPFSSYGVDSILAVSIIKIINEQLGIELDVTAMFEHTTVEQLSAHMLTTFPAELQRLTTANENAVEPPSTADPADACNNIAAADEADARNNIAAAGEADALIVNAPSSAGEADTLIVNAPSFADDIAIIGIDGQFAAAENPQRLWQNLEAGHCAISSLPTERREWSLHQRKVTGSFLQHVHTFDPAFFAIPLAEAKLMPPEQRLLLMSVWNAVEQAGYAMKTLSADITGVFVAAGPGEYHHIVKSRGSADGLINIPGQAMTPNRISYHFNLRGPSEYFDTTCSSALVALQHAVESLRKGECHYAIVAGINLIMSPEGFDNLDAVGMLSQAGKVMPFQQNATGTLRGEGVGAVLLKSLQAAIADKDNIQAVIKGVGVAHGGKGVSLTAPNIQGMKSAIQKALENGRVSAASVSYVEAHGMASTLADSAEIAALKSRYDEGLSTPLYITSLKPCLGHTEVVSGLAALFRTIMAMKHQTIPAISGFTQLNEQISLQGTRLVMADKSVPWRRDENTGALASPRRAAINSFGISGINAHLILEEAPARNNSAAADKDEIIILSARTQAQLRQRIVSLRDFCQHHPHACLADIAGTLQFGRTMMPVRFALIVSSLSDLIEQLTRYLAQEKDESQASYSHSEKNSALAALFSGEAGAEILNTLLLQNRLEEILNYWCAGASVNWHLLNNHDYCKVPLPGYPFEQIDCWIDEIPGSEQQWCDESAQNTINKGALNWLINQLGVSREALDFSKSLADYGVNSLMFMVICKQLSKFAVVNETLQLKIDMPLRDLISQLRPHDAVTSDPARFPELIHLNGIQQGTPIFWIHGALGSVEAYQFLAARCARPFYGIEARGAMTESEPLEGIEAIADYYLQIIKTVQPVGPYDIGGYCLGGIIAYEISRKLQMNNEQVNSLVLIDSPDNQGFNKAARSANIPLKNAALQVANTLLWPGNVTEISQIPQRMIHQDEVDESLSDEDFIIDLGNKVNEKGANIDPVNACAFIRRNIKVQVAYQLNAYKIQPLPAPEEIKSLYFRNKNGYFLGALKNNFQTRSTIFDLDQVNYWQEWQQAMPGLHVIDLNVANHMTMLFEAEAKEVVQRYCQEIYTTEEVMG